jgi:hypothetical protein
MNVLAKAAFALGFGMTACCAQAQQALTPEAFDDYTRGKTLNYASDGEIYGAEIYRENHHVTWSFLDGECQDGTWYGQNDQICFLYENSAGPSCWKFFMTATGLRAEFISETSSIELYETTQRASEMICLGPEIGV